MFTTKYMVSGESAANRIAKMKVYGYIYDPVNKVWIRPGNKKIEYRESNGESANEVDWTR